MKIASNEESDAITFSYLCQESSKFACFASQSKKCAKIFIEGLNKMSNKLAKVKLEEKEKQGENETQSLNERECDQIITFGSAYFNN